MFGMGKVTFEKTLSLLKKDIKILRQKGGKKSQLSDLDQLLIAIECKQAHRSMDEIAKKYGVGKTTISEVNKRVSEILKNESE
jgi:transposase